MLLALTLALGAVVAQADLPNANLPGNSPTLPNSNTIGSHPTDNPISLPNTDTAGDIVIERNAAAERQAKEERVDNTQQETLQVAAKALEEAARARAEAAEGRQQLIDALEQRQP